MEPFGLTDFSDDTRHGQAVARVRVLEQRLITKRRFIRMADARSSEALLDELRGTDYSEPIAHVRHPGQIPAAFEKIADQRLRLAQELGVPPDILRVLEAWRAVSTAKREVRVQHAGSSSDRRSDSVRILDDSRTRRGSNHPEGPLRAACAEAAADFERSRSLFRLDMLLDRAFSIYLHEASEKRAIPFARHLVRYYLDLQAVGAVFRWRTWLESGAPAGGRAGRIDAHLLPVPGFLSGDLLKSTSLEPWERVPASFQYTPYGRVVREGVEHHQKAGSWWYFEKLSDDFITDFCRLGRYTPFGVEPLIAYGWFVWQEARNVRMVVTARQSGIAAEHIIPRLREGYHA